MRAVEIDELPPADQLWWTAACLAARDRATGRSGWDLDAGNQVLHHAAPDGSLLRLQRLLGGRFAIWGIDPDDTLQRGWTGIPGWATSDVAEWWERSGATFVAWHTRDGWDTATPEASLAPLAPLLRAHADGIAAAVDDADALAALIGEGDGELARVVLTQARREAPTTQGRVRRMLAHEIHAQMARGPERDRVLPQRPVPVVRWVRAARPPAGFAFAVHLEGDAIVEDATNHRLADQFHRSLLTLFEVLHHEEAEPASGGWMFARLTYDGINAGFDRAFDSRPHWYSGDGPTLETLAAEMARRTPEWRPAWSRLL